MNVKATAKLLTIIRKEKGAAYYNKLVSRLTKSKRESDRIAALRLIDELGKKLLKERYYYFFIYTWETVSTERLVENWHIEYLCDELQKVGTQVIERRKKLYDLIINISPGESKSTIATILFPVWLWVNDPSLRIISASHSISLSGDHALASKDCIQSEIFGHLFSDLFEMRKDVKGKKNYQNTHGGFRKAVSVGSKVMGKHAHIWLVDDPIDPKGASSEAVLKSTNDYMNKTVPSRMIDKANTPLILIMQRLHEDDPTGNLLSKAKRSKFKKVKHICLPASDEFPVSPRVLKKRYKDGLMNPLRTGKDVLEEQKVSLGSHEFSAQFGQSAQPLKGNLMKEKHFKIHSFIRSTDFYDYPKICFCDPAVKAKDGNDPTGLMSVKGYKGHLYITFYKEFRQDYEERKDTTVEFVEEENGEHGTIFIENKGSGVALVDSINRHTKINAIEFPAPPFDKVAKIRSKMPFLEAGKLHILTKRHGEEWDWKEFIKNCLLFPYAKHDERIDLIYFAIDTFENYPVLFEIPTEGERKKIVLID